MRILMTRACRAMARKGVMAGGLALGLLLSPLQASAQTGDQAGQWVASWASSPSLPQAKLPFDFWTPAPSVQGTVRYRLRLSAGGDLVQVRLSGETQVEDTQIGAATIALADDAGKIDPASIRPLSFDGAASVRLPAGAPLVSDPLALPVRPGAVVVVSLYLPSPTVVPQASPEHPFEVLDGGDRTNDPGLAGARTLVGREIVSSVLVRSDPKAASIVAFGDSITDGFASRDPLMRGWPGQLARILREEGLGNIGVANAGIGGNRLLREEVGPSGLSRFDRDALSVPGVTQIVVLEGINDLGLSGLQNPRAAGLFPDVTAADLIAGYKQLIVRAHARKLRIYGATLTPFLGSPFPGYATPAKEKTRQEINRWIRESGAFDGVIDFDLAIRDPKTPEFIRSDYDSGDKLHPSDAGYRAMAKAAREVLGR